MVKLFKYMIILLCISAIPAYSNDMKGVVVVGTWGRDGENGGMEYIIKVLKDKLVPLGVPAENIYVQRWSELGDELPGPAPTTTLHFNLIMNKLQRQGFSLPSYLVLFGHSFGGWEAARLSRKMHQHGYTPDVVFLFDPVIGPAHYTIQREKMVNSRYGVSYYQTNTVQKINPCLDVLPGNTCLLSANISCGFFFYNLTDGNRESIYRRDARGEIIKKQCSSIPGISLKMRWSQSHVTIDDDKHLQKKLIKRVVRDVTAIHDRQ